MIQVRLNTLRVKLESCRTFVTVAEIKHELGDESNAQRFLTQGQREYISLLRLFSESVLSGNKELRSDIMRTGEELNRVRRLTQHAV